MIETFRRKLEFVNLHFGKVELLLTAARDNKQDNGTRSNENRRYPVVIHRLQSLAGSIAGTRISIVIRRILNYKML